DAVKAQLPAFEAGAARLEPALGARLADHMRRYQASMAALGVAKLQEQSAAERLSAVHRELDPLVAQLRNSFEGTLRTVRGARDAADRTAHTSMLLGMALT